MKLIKRNTGFTLIELVIVIAISLLLIGIVSGVYVLRRQTAYDDAAQQVASSIQTIRNEAQQGSGVSVTGASGNVAGVTIQPGDKIYGQTIKFKQDCGGGVSCMEVNKLLSRDVGGGTVKLFPYDSYQVAIPEGLRYVNVLNANTNFSTGYTPTIDPTNNGTLTPPTSYTAACPGSGARELNCLPLNNGLYGAFITIPNLQNNKMLLVKHPTTYPLPTSGIDESAITTNAQSGVLYLALANSDNTAQYYIAVDLSSNGTIKAIKI
jgi:prepilin-type N-terminal cleavage/methylation domain-containing protein